MYNEWDERLFSETLTRDEVALEGCKPQDVILGVAIKVNSGEVWENSHQGGSHSRQSRSFWTWTAFPAAWGKLDGTQLFAQLICFLCFSCSLQRRNLMMPWQIRTPAQPFMWLPQSLPQSLTRWASLPLFTACMVRGREEGDEGFCCCLFILG